MLYSTTIKFELTFAYTIIFYSQYKMGWNQGMGCTWKLTVAIDQSVRYATFVHECLPLGTVVLSGLLLELETACPGQGSRT